MSLDELKRLRAELEKKMAKAAAELEFEAAATYRDRLAEVKRMLHD